jgi:aminoglycoside N3'-acetyltransferase
MTERRTWSLAEIVAQLRGLGVTRGGVLLVHTAFRATGPVQGGPAGLIAALREALGPEGTLAMPSWTGDDDAVFDPATTPADPALGVVPDTFWWLPDVLRSGHPMAFAARGRRAEELVEGPMVLPPNGPGSALERLVAAEGRVLLLGVGHDANTTIHFAELAAGVPYRRSKHVTVAGPDGPRRIDYGENDCCCRRFALAEDWLAGEGAIAHGAVGNAAARLMRACDLVRIVAARLYAAPLAFLCDPAAGCGECDDARAGVGRGPEPAP